LCYWIALNTSFINDLPKVIVSTIEILLKVSSLFGGFFFPSKKMLFSFKKNDQISFTTNSDTKFYFFLSPHPLFPFLIKNAKILEKKKNAKKTFWILQTSLSIKFHRLYKISLRASRIVIFQALIKIEDRSTWFSIVRHFPSFFFFPSCCFS